MIMYSILIIIISTILFVNFAPTFGDSAKGDSLDKIKSSKNFDGKKFKNLIETKMMTNSSENDSSMIGGLMNMISPPKDKNPQEMLPSKKFVKEDLKNDSYVWFGHSTVLMKTSGVTIITDPVFNRASPIPIGGSAFKVKNITNIEDLSKIDVVVISHDHYDHLDYNAIKDLDEKVEKFFVPLGVKAHLLKWGISEDKIVEKDWYENVSYKDVNFTFAPTRHFSGRGLTNRDSTLWGSWIINSKSQNIYFSGDSGYFDEFKKIGDNYGPFDIAFIECGAYNKAWIDIHMLPEQSVQAGLDLNSKTVVPIHWSKFDLSLHNWTEPIERFSKEAENKNLGYLTPMIGEVFKSENIENKETINNKWWK